MEPSARLCTDNQCGANERNKKQSNQIKQSQKNRIVDPNRHHPNATSKEALEVAPQQCSVFENRAQMPERGERKSIRYDDHRT
jgi:hypothetical protein